MDFMDETPPSAGSQVVLAHTIFEGLRDEITGGKLKPGETLSRRGIARRYGTSSIPVIEALARLESTGLVEAEARQTARVRKISLETIQNDYVLREAYETQAIRRVCETATDEEIETLYEMAEAVDACVRAGGTKKKSEPTGPLLHWQFHKQIAKLSRCRALVIELERIELLRRLQANWYFSPESPDPPHHHSRLVDAIRDRDPTQADMVMRAHIRKGWQKELLAYQMNTNV